MDYTVTELKKASDERGFLVEFLKQSELAGEKAPFGQIYLTTIAPGTLRGNHFHHDRVEYFALMCGHANVTIEDTRTKERIVVALDASGDRVVRVRVGPKVAHAIYNDSDTDVILCAYTDGEYDPAKVDQEVYKLI